MADEEIVRQMIRHEDDMRNHRITWLVTIQGLLFTALGFSWGKETRLVYLLSLVGILVALSSLIALKCTRHAVKRLYDGCRKDNQNQTLWYPDVLGYWSDSITIKYLSPWFFLPVIFMAAWLALSILNFTGLIGAINIIKADREKEVKELKDLQSKLIDSKNEIESLKNIMTEKESRRNEEMEHLKDKFSLDCEKKTLKLEKEYQAQIQSLRDEYNQQVRKLLQQIQPQQTSKKKRQNKRGLKND